MESKMNIFYGITVEYSILQILQRFCSRKWSVPRWKAGVCLSIFKNMKAIFTRASLQLCTPDGSLQVQLASSKSILSILIIQIRFWTTPSEEMLELVKALSDKLTHKLKLPLELLNMPICQQKRGSSSTSLFCLTFSIIQLHSPSSKSKCL